MDITRVAITDMPGLGGVEFMLQWGGLFIQAAAAAATFGAVVVALKVARRDGDWRRDRESREAALVWEILFAQQAEAFNAFAALNNELDDLIQPDARVRTKEDRLAGVGFVRARLDLDPLWRVTEKIGWLPPQVGTEVGRLLAITPTYLNGVESVFHWKGASPELLDHVKALMEMGHMLMQCCVGIDNARREARGF